MTVEQQEQPKQPKKEEPKINYSVIAFGEKIKDCVISLEPQKVTIWDQNKEDLDIDFNKRKYYDEEEIHIYSEWPDSALQYKCRFKEVQNVHDYSIEKGDYESVTRKYTHDIETWNMDATFEEGNEDEILIDIKDGLLTIVWNYYKIDKNNYLIENDKRRNVRHKTQEVTRIVIPVHRIINIMTNHYC